MPIPLGKSDAKCLQPDSVNATSLKINTTGTIPSPTETAGGQRPSAASAFRLRVAGEKGSDTNGTNLGCLSEPRALAVGLRRILTTFSSPTASARGSKPVPFGSDTKNRNGPKGCFVLVVSDPFSPIDVTPNFRFDEALADSSDSQSIHQIQARRAVLMLRCLLDFVPKAQRFT